MWGIIEKTEVPYESNVDAHYIHNQIAASDTWTIVHNLGKRPSVTVVDSAQNAVIGDIHFDSLNQITLTFSAEFSGTAYLN